jgi:MoxR-like ATPase
VSDHPSTQDLALVEKLRTGYAAITAQLARVIVGQQEVIEQLLTALFCRGHVLVVGVPGTAKTLLVSSIARILDLKFQRIQFTPDLMPSDITGTEVIEQDPATGARSFRFIHGPVFGQIILADEINRTPPKTQAALLQAMQEYAVTAGGQTYPLPLPFFVLATQNPIEQEGTYPLPEAQLDRFFFQIAVDYPTEQEEKQVVLQTTGDVQPELQRVLTADDIIALQTIVRRVPAAEHAVDYAVRLARATRPQSAGSPEFVRQFVRWGAGPRGAQALVLAAKARALICGRPAVSRDDIDAVALPCLRHRVLVNFHAEAEGITTEKIITRLIEQHVSA